MTYRERLLLVIDEWNTYPITNEWLFENFRSNVIGELSTSDAFDAIDETIVILLREPDESTATEIIQSIIALAHQSKTTEVPIELIRSKTEIVTKVRSFGDYANIKLQELFRYYRLS
jgi:hypothetical protein